MARLSNRQRDIIVAGPASFAEADAIPEVLFEEDVTYDPETGEENYFWTVTALGRRVRALIEAAEERRGQGDTTTAR